MMVFRRKQLEDLVIPGIDRLKKPKDLVQSLRRVDDILDAHEDELTSCLVDGFNHALTEYFDACDAGHDAHAHVVGACLARAVFRCIEGFDRTLPEMEGALKAFAQTVDYYYKIQKTR